MKFSVAPDQVGRAWRMDDATGRYIEFLKGGMAKGDFLPVLKLLSIARMARLIKSRPRFCGNWRRRLSRLAIVPMAAILTKAAARRM